MKIERLIFLTLLFAALCAPFIGKGQHKVILNMPTYDQEMFHFGFVLGVNQSLVSIRPISDLGSHVFYGELIPTDLLPKPDSVKVLAITSTPIPGFVISIVANMQMGRDFELQFVPSLSFGDRTINYDLETITLLSGGRDTSQQFTKVKKIPSTYINFPLEIKYKAFRYNNFRPYLLAGVQYSLDLASQAKKREQKNVNEKIVKFNQNDVYLEVGVGFDFYNEWFKFGLELKMLYGFQDVLKHENNVYTESIDKVSSKIFQVSFTFE